MIDFIEEFNLLIFIAELNTYLLPLIFKFENKKSNFFMERIINEPNDPNKHESVSQP